MTLNKNLQQFMEAAQEDEAFWTEQAKIDFALALDEQRRRQNLSLTDLARKLGTSPAYITKVFRGDSNFTIDTMAKLARATGAQLSIEVHPLQTAPKVWTMAGQRPALRLVSGPTTTQVEAPGSTPGESPWRSLRVAA